VVALGLGVHAALDLFGKAALGVATRWSGLVRAACTSASAD
jgi:hypothetical protein